MKVRSSVKPICEKCKVIKKKGQSQNYLRKPKTQAKTRIMNHFEYLKRASLGCFRVYKFQFLLSVLQHQPS